MPHDTTDHLKVPIADFPGFNLRAAANAAMTRLSEILGAFDLRITEASILVIVQANPGCRQSDIGRALNIASANLTPMLHKLEKRGLISRIPLDGRTNALDLTKAGHSKAEDCLKAMQDFEAFLVEQIRPLQETDLNSALKSITAALSGPS
jgi:DNA-binding MarR family transcriptional regulator